MDTYVVRYYERRYDGSLRKRKANHSFDGCGTKDALRILVARYGLRFIYSITLLSGQNGEGVWYASELVDYLQLDIPVRTTQNLDSDTPTLKSSDPWFNYHQYTNDSRIQDFGR